MTWGLAVHNAYRFIAPPIGDPDSTETGTTEYTDTSSSYNLTAEFGMDIMLAYGANGKVMGFADSGVVIFSSDYGDTWADTGTAAPDFGSGRKPTKCAYQVSNSRWFLSTSTNTGQLRLYYSDDDGATWTRWDDDASSPQGSRAYRAFTIDSQDRVVVATRDPDDNQGVKVWRWDDPIADALTFSSSSVDSDFGGNCTVLEIFDDPASDSYFIVLANSAVRDIIQFYYDLTATPAEYDFDQDGDEYYTAAHDGTSKLLLLGDPDTTVATDDIHLWMFQDGDVSADVYDLGWSEDIFKSVVAIEYGDRWVVVVRPDGATKDYLLMKWSDTGESGSWSAETQINLGFNLETGNAGTGGFAICCAYVEEGRYLIAVTDTSDTMRIVSIEFGSNPIAEPQSPLRLALEAQQADILLLMDDEDPATTVEDLGTKGYVNAATSALTFGQTGLISDTGTAVSVDNATGGVYFESVPVPGEHAHVFVLDRGATAGILAGYGDFSGSDYAYKIEIDGSNKIKLSYYDSAGDLQTLTSDTAISDATQLVAVHLSEIDGKATIYIEDELDKQDTTFSLQALSGDAKLSLLGGWNDGDTITNAVTGTVLDYYALIPGDEFSYSAINAAYGGTYTEPAAPTEVDPAATVEILVHAEDAALTNNGTFKQVINDGNPNNVLLTEYTRILDTTEAKFGSQSIEIPEVDESVNTQLFRKNFLNATGVLEFGTREFTLDLWVKPANDNIIVLAANNLVGRTNNYLLEYNGLYLEMFKDPSSSSLGALRLTIPKSKTETQPYATRQLEIYCTGFPDYDHADWNHVALSRRVRADGTQKWFLFVNGRKEASRRVLEGIPGAYTDAFIYRGGWLGFGARAKATSSGRNIFRFQNACFLDEIRLVLDEAIFREEFTPPTSAYT